MSKLQTEDLIDLGAASAETRGMQTSYAADDALQHRPTPGLLND